MVSRRSQPGYYGEHHGPRRGGSRFTPLSRQPWQGRGRMFFFMRGPIHRMTGKEYEQIAWGPAVDDELRAIVQLAIAEDLGGEQDWTTAALVPADLTAEAYVVPRSPGVIAGLPAGSVVLDEMNFVARFVPLVADGHFAAAGERVARLVGPAAQILTAERPILNILGRLSGVATTTHRYVQAVAGLPVRIYDTRKTTPGWRLLEKYAVLCGGGTNHRSGLHRAVLIKDNHVAFGQRSAKHHFSIDQAIDQCRHFVAIHAADGEAMIVEVEVDSLSQLGQVLPKFPDIVLLDNMSTDQLQQAVGLRDRLAPTVELEASGGVTLDTIRAIAGTGVDRISVGALTHSAPSLDVGLDWVVDHP